MADITPSRSSGVQKISLFRFFAVNQSMERSVTESALVYGPYNQKQLDEQYDQRTLVHDPQVYKARKILESERVRAKLTGSYNLQYGSSPDEILDIFWAATSDRPMLVFVHGGAWKAGHKDESSYVAEWFVQQDINVAILNFSLVPDVRLEDQVSQVALAIRWLHSETSQAQFDRDRLVVLGHSSGAHVAAMMGVWNWGESCPIKGVAAFSGMYDLEPVRLSWRNQYLKLNEAQASSLSPIKMLSPGQPPMVIGFGSEELAEFQRQGRDFCAALRKAGHDVHEMIFEGKNHFDVQEMLTNPESSLVKSVLSLFDIEVRA